VLPLLPSALGALLPPAGGDAGDLIDALLLLNQLAARFKAQLAPLMRVRTALSCICGVLCCAVLCCAVLCCAVLWH
jgi:hypothetical protein